MKIENILNVTEIFKKRQNLRPQKCNTKIGIFMVLLIAN